MLSTSLYHFRGSWGLIFVLIWGVACAPQPPRPSPGHLGSTAATASFPPKEDIPPPIQQLPFVPPPQKVPSLETYTVVVSEVPVDKLLFALARDAGVDVDIHPGIRGKVTLNAINQTLPQLLERIAQQVNLRYQMDGNHLVVAPDLPYWHQYKVSYVNLSRDSKSEVTVLTHTSTVSSEAGAGKPQGENNSTTKITSTSNHHFWESLEKNILAILADGEKKSSESGESSVILNRESGIISVRTTAKHHQEIQQLIDLVMVNVQRQVLIEATVAEVRLSDQYQAGVDWKRIAGDYTYEQSVSGDNLALPPFYAFSYQNPNSQFGDIAATVKLLEQFGTVKVLSSPKMMALNNQTAILRVTDNIVYFTFESPSNNVSATGNANVTAMQQPVAKPNFVPVGLIMSVTPQIGEDDEVTLNIRPTISRVFNFKNDPTPSLAMAGVLSPVPEIQLREIESVLKIHDGNIAVIGGLMQDSTGQNKTGLPVLSQLPLVGDLFSYRNDKYEKTELVIFLRPVVVKEASLSGDLQEYKTYLPTPNSDNIPPTGFTQH